MVDEPPQSVGNVVAEKRYSTFIVPNRLSVSVSHSTSFLPHTLMLSLDRCLPHELAFPPSFIPRARADRAEISSFHREKALLLSAAKAAGDKKKRIMIEETTPDVLNAKGLLMFLRQSPSTDSAPKRVSDNVGGGGGDGGGGSSSSGGSVSGSTSSCLLYTSPSPRD